MDNTFHSLAAMSLEGMEGLEVTSPEDTVEVLVAMTMAKDHLEVTMEVVDMAMEAPEVEVEAEARLGHHHQALGLGTMIEMAGMASAAMDSSMSKAKSLMRKLPRVLSISTPACQEE